MFVDVQLCYDRDQSLTVASVCLQSSNESLSDSVVMESEQINIQWTMTLLFRTNPVVFMFHVNVIISHCKALFDQQSSL